jgi:leucyl aminopeptidase
MVALGAKVAGVMGNADVVARLRTAGDATNERVWELPLWDDEYGKMIDSDVADMKNAGGRNGGAISAGKFLEKFAGDIPWAHVDMAGLELRRATGCACWLHSSRDLPRQTRLKARPHLTRFAPC